MTMNCIQNNQLFSEELQSALNKKELYNSIILLKL